MKFIVWKILYLKLTFSNVLQRQKDFIKNKSVLYKPEKRIFNKEVKSSTIINGRQAYFFKSKFYMTLFYTSFINRHNRRNDLGIIYNDVAFFFFFK